MRKTLFLGLCSLCCTGLYAQEKLISLDLSKADVTLEFNETTGAWIDTYNDDVATIESQCFSFVHGSVADWNTWWGFTLSNSTDNSMRDNFLKFQFSNMAEGGILLNEDGSVKLNDFGMPLTSAEMPYLVAFYSPYMAARPVDMTFKDSKVYEAVGVYVNLNSYPYYSIEYGDSFARAFTNGDSFTLTVHGVASSGDERSVEVELAAYSNGNLTINRGWRYVDLSSLGEVNELYFTLKSTDSGPYGDNTPAYFCMDKLIVKECDDVSAVASHNRDARISYDRLSRTVKVAGSGFSAVYDASGSMVSSSEDESYSISHLPAGVYIIRAGNRSLKITK